jgi:hypothetical protein
VIKRLFENGAVTFAGRVIVIHLLENGLDWLHDILE